MAHRVIIAGLFHETHTFLETGTSLAAFAERRGEEMSASRDDGSPLSGALEVATASGWQIVPAIDLRATPSGTVEDEVVERFWRTLHDAIERERSRGIDGLFLVLHGAMVSRSIGDVEGEILRRIRGSDGLAEVPICAVLDLHGNISRATAELAQGLVAYRCNPHTDARSAAIDAARLLDRLMCTGERARTVWRQVPVLWPPTGTGTDDDPMRQLEARAREIERAHPDILAVNVFGGFAFADTRDTGVSFTATTVGDSGRAAQQLDTLAEWAIANRELGNVVEQPLADAMPSLLADVAAGRTPALLVEPSDNIGGGAPGDGTSILRALLEARIEHSVVVINDPRAVAALADCAVGARATLAIGGKGSRMSEGPVSLEVELEGRSDGRFELEDRASHLASMQGVRIDMGPCATVRHDGVHIIVTSRKTPPFDLGQLRSQGIEPGKMSVIGVKAAVAHRRAYDAIAKASYSVLTPGPCSSDLTVFPFAKIRRPVFPLDR